MQTDQLELADSHCHINFPQLEDQLDDVIDLAQQMSVRFMLCVAVNLEDYPQILALSDAYDNIFASVGVHPNETDGEDPSVDRLVDLGTDNRVVAIGETGLDYYRSAGELDWQRERFVRHIEAGRTLNKPIIIHSRNAPEDTISIMKSHFAGEAGGVMHCFTGDYEMAKAALDQGFFISFSGIVTFKNATDLAEVAKKIPLDRMLIETDAPYLAPVPKRGKQNQPGYVRYTAEFLAELRDMKLEDFAAITTANFLELFNIQRPDAVA